MGSLYTRTVLVSGNEVQRSATKALNEYIYRWSFACQPIRRLTKEISLVEGKRQFLDHMEDLWTYLS